MALSDAEKILYRTRLTKAEASYHLLMTGEAVVQFVDQNGEQVKYNADRVSLTRLETYIESLKQLLDPCRAKAAMRRPLGFLF